jgi:DNA-binding XRE family transcriptional regulator
MDTDSAQGFNSPHPLQDVVHPTWVAPPTRTPPPAGPEPAGRGGPRRPPRPPRPRPARARRRPATAAGRALTGCASTQLGALRRRLGLSQTAMAQRLPSHPHVTTISAFERGSHQYFRSAADLRAYADALGISVDEVLRLRAPTTLVVSRRRLRPPSSRQAPGRADGDGR